MKKNSNILSKYRGCLLGLAVGDALGAPVEFLSLDSIKEKYGKDGITEYDGWESFQPGAITDDTQMSLATATGCIKAVFASEDGENIDSTEYVYTEYLNWLSSQADPFQRRAAGSTCLGALRSKKMGTISNPINDSKGCGGVMRTAPIGMAFFRKRAFDEGAKVAAITHGHPSGYISAGFLSQVIAEIIKGKGLKIAIEDSLEKLNFYEGKEETMEKVKLAVNLASDFLPVEMAIKQIGEGWVGEEALGISLYCALKFLDNYRSGVIAAVNHSGDSDSTGSITGAILGAQLGGDAIPKQWIHTLEDSKEIDGIASQMYKLFWEDSLGLWSEK